jgi:methionine-rich copper-binding protein CopC
MTLKTVALTGPDGRTVPITVRPSAAAAQASVTLPALKPGAWRAAYKATGADGHDMTGLVRFTVR